MEAQRQYIGFDAAEESLTESSWSHPGAVLMHRFMQAAKALSPPYEATGLASAYVPGRHRAAALFAEWFGIALCALCGAPQLLCI